ncbi:Protein kinase domain-containing protein [Mycena sanguinolenta]|uniref:Protein kinase domain-containing protein n=1 Tax=Mycena sanguinolenta TaxID=230812 RepID=A0A8H6Z5C8_9AGAR|nr:Protein kinase domain-containing protein [Mycena sanguinolenta]
MSRPTLAPGPSTHTSLRDDTQGKMTAPKSSHSALASQTQAEDSTIDAAESYYSQANEWKDQLEDFFAENASTINNAENVLSVALDVKNIEEKFTALAQTSRTIMAGLDILGQIHPFISLAAQAFKLAINIDVTRRENDKKVLAVQLQMQDMIVVLFLLRHIRDPKEKVGGQTVETRMRGLVQSIANHVTSCRSACEGYQKKGFIPKMIKCKDYEDRLATYAQIFADDKREIQFSLQLYMTYGVDEIKQKLDQQGAYFKAQMQELFRKLETAHERDVQNLIERNGGAQNCVENDEVLRELFAMGGEILATRHEVANARKSLQKELTEEVDEALKKHIGLLSHQQLEKQNDLVLKTVTSDKEGNPRCVPQWAAREDFGSEIWREQGWRGSVPGQDFVSALNEYYEEKLAKSGDSAEQADTRSLHDSERWALGYINSAHARAIIEAVDDDGSGSVSIKEVSNFTALKPNGWSLTSWIAFWAVGWYPTVAWYKEKIESILAQSTSLSQYVHPDNLRAANRISEGWEEELLKTRLEEGSYFLEQLATVQQVSNHRRIDHYIFPLLYLLLNYHWDTMRRAGSEPLDDSEFTSMSTSLDTIFEAVEWRLDELEAMFQINLLDVKERLSRFSFGMFQLLYDLKDEDGVEINSAPKTKNEHDGVGIHSTYLQDTRNPVTALAVGPAHTVAATPVEVPEDRQDKIDTREPAFERLNTYFLDNASTISNAGDALTAVFNSDVKSIASKIARIAESSKVLIAGLEELAKVHPFVAVAVLAFKMAMLFVREDNKVLAVMIQMQDMMTAFFQLRHLRNSDAKGPDGETLKDRLVPIIVSIVEDIKSCSNACDLYMKKRSFVKLIKAQIFEERFANYVARFSEHKRRLMLAMSIGTTSLNVRVMQSQVEELFQKLETPREREVQRFIDQHGGAPAIVQDELSLQKLITKNDETLSRLDASTALNEGLASAKNLSTRELTENVDEMKIDMQAQQQREERVTIRALSASPHDRILDPELAALWKKQGWKSSVNGGKFVLALNDYSYVDGAGVTSTDTEKLHDSSSPPVDHSSSTVYEERHWELAYINGGHLRRILEAINDEGTGFVSLKNANSFARSPRRPKGWNLRSWVAF